MPNTTVPNLFKCSIESNNVSIIKIQDLPNPLNPDVLYIGIDSTLFPLDLNDTQEVNDYISSLLLDPTNTTVLPGVVKYSY